jgi:ubiquitin-like 1-activating enzyme E1 B
LAAGVPLIESGTAGYLGQVQVIKSGVSECYECVPQAPPKTFPICTIRLNPSTTVHCIVWAQSIYKRFFGVREDGEENQDENEAVPKDETEGELTEEESIEQAALKTIVENDRNKLQREKDKSFIRGFFHQLFHTDVLYLSTLKSLWVGKTPPNPIFLSETNEELDEQFDHISPFFESYVNNAALPDQRVWGPKENALKFLESAKALYELNTKEKWEKDNQIHLDFVTSAANLRACVFHLDLSSRFFVKEQAGNIIPAIATTNAIAAGLIVMKALRILDGKLNECQNTYLRKQPNRGILFLGAFLDKPNPTCYVCSKHMITVVLNTEKMKVRSLVDDIIKKTIMVTSPMIGMGNTTLIDGGFADESDDEELEFYETELNKLLNQKKITHNVILDLTDNNSSIKIDLIIIHDSSKNEEEYEIIGTIPEIVPDEDEKKPAIEEKEKVEEMEVEKEKKKETGGVIEIDDEDDMIITVAQPQEQSKKRKAEDDIGDGLETKKSKAS